MHYFLIRAGGVDLLQEVHEGIVLRHCDLDGNTVEAPQGAFVVGDYPAPLWAAAIPAPTSAPVVQVRHITKLAFRNRFSQAEKVAIEIASLDVPSAPMQQRAMAAALRANQADVQASKFIDLDRADTRAGVQQLEAVGLIAPGRAAAILDSPVQASETHTDA